MKSLKIYLMFAVLVLGASSCQKVIDLHLGNVSGLLVIEGNVTNAPGTQTVLLSQNVAFTSTNTYPPVTGASVSVTDSLGNNYPFTEGPAGTYTNNVLVGKPGNSYSITVATGGKTYQAASTMPPAVVLDSLTSDNDVFSKGDNKKEILVHYQDPADVVNYYRFVMFVNSVQVKSVFAYNDQFIDGRYVNLSLPENDIDIYPGDTVSVEMQCIDKPVYTYWYTLMQQQQNGPGGGVTPSNPPTNITPATLGYFSAHTTQRKTIIVKN
jgi:Domain of unknown function (DUF4249)